MVDILKYWSVAKVGDVGEAEIKGFVVMRQEGAPDGCNGMESIGVEEGASGSTVCIEP